MPRLKGYKLSDEQKEKMRAGRMNRKVNKVAVEPKPTGRPIAHITGVEKTGFEFWTPLRKALRPVHLYSLLKRLEVDITRPDVWQDVRMIRNILECYVILEESLPAPVKKVRKPRKARV